MLVTNDSIMNILKSVGTRTGARTITVGQNVPFYHPKILTCVKVSYRIFPGRGKCRNVEILDKKRQIQM